MEYNCGVSGYITLDTWQSTKVTKHTKKVNIEKEYNIHKIAYDICCKNKFNILKVPMVYNLSSNKKMYNMERINDSCMVTNLLSVKGLENEVSQFVSNLQHNGIKAFDFELYLQDDGSVFLIDFDKFDFLS